MNKIIAMIPARLGSQRLKKKNLEMFGEFTLIEHAIIRCIKSNIFDDIYVNSESEVFADYAKKHKVKFYKRPALLGNNQATSEEFVEDFLNNIECESLYQIHSITPLLSAEKIREFVQFCESHPEFNTVLSCIHDQIEVAYQNQPINFTFNKKTNSQELKPTQRITWSATKWSKSSYLNAKKNKSIGTYSGNVGFFEVPPFSGLAIKTIDDLIVANALRDLV